MFLKPPTMEPGTHSVDVPFLAEGCGPVPQFTQQPTRGCCWRRKSSSPAWTDPEQRPRTPRPQGGQPRPCPQRGEREPHLLEDVLLIEEGAVLWKENTHTVGCMGPGLFPSSFRATPAQPPALLPQPVEGSNLVGPETTS